MDEILLYRGCTTPVRYPNYEAATIAVLKKLERRQKEGVWEA